MPFKKGQSGNPSGKKNGSKEFSEMLRLAIKEAHDEGNTKLRAVADALVNKALTGDVQAIKEVADRLDGKVPQAVVGDPDNPIEHRHELDAERFTRAIAGIASRARAEKDD